MADTQHSEVEPAPNAGRVPTAATKVRDMLQRAEQTSRPRHKQKHATFRASEMKIRARSKLLVEGPCVHCETQRNMKAAARSPAMKSCQECHRHAITYRTLRRPVPYVVRLPERGSLRS